MIRKFFSDNSEYCEVQFFFLMMGADHTVMMTRIMAKSPKHTHTHTHTHTFQRPAEF